MSVSYVFTLLTDRASTSKPPVLSTCPVHTNSACGKKEGHINWFMVNDM